MAGATYLRSAPVRRLRHPMEDSPVWSFLGNGVTGLLGAAVAVPILLVLVVLLPVCVVARWFLLLLYWNRQPSSSAAGGGPESVRGNDDRYLGSAWRSSVMHAVLVFEPGPGVDVSGLRHLLLTRVLPLYPRLTRRPVPLPLSAGAGHCWLPDTAFNIDKHVFAGPESIKTEQQLQEYVGRLVGEGLSRDKPPWELRVLTGYGHLQDTVTVLRVHQSVADGMSLVRLLCHSLADCHVLHVPQHPPPGSLRFPMSVARACLMGPLSLLLWLLLASEDCNLLTQKKGWSGHVTVTWSAAITLSKVTRIKQVTRSSVNCVLLSALAGAARRLLQGCGVTQPPDMKVVMPVDVRGPSRAVNPRLGSKIAPVVLALPVSLEGAVPRLWAARQHLRALRSSADAVVVYVATAALMAVAPGGAARRLLSALTARASLQYSALQGPQGVLQVAGAALKSVYPLLPAQGAIGIAISVFTYADHVYVTVASDTTLGPAADLLLTHLHGQVELLWQLLLHRRVPGEARSHVTLRCSDVASSPVRELRLRLSTVQDEVQRLSQGGEDSRLLNLKSEFSELLSELRRRQSSVGEGSPVFEDEEVGGELWQPRRRAMSCTSSRRSSRSLMLLLTARRPASFVCPQNDVVVDVDEREAERDTDGERERGDTCTSVSAQCEQGSSPACQMLPSHMNYSYTLLESGRTSCWSLPASPQEHITSPQQRTRAHSH